MRAGRGIVHSERTGPETRAAGSRLFGAQAWVALPMTHEEAEPDFVHLPESEQPVVEGEGKRVRLIAGSLYGARARADTLWDMHYADAVLEAGARLEVPAEHHERALYIVEGRVQIAGDAFGAGRLLVLRPGDPIAVRADGPARLLLLGGEPMDGPRHLWWNFVASSKERLEQAKEDWRAGRFPAVPGETEFIPLPEEPKRPVSYP